MDHLKEGIGLRGHAQKDPLIEYKKESFILFQEMMDRIEEETIRFLFFLRVAPSDEPLGPGRPVLPFSTEDETSGDEEEQEELIAAGSAQRKNAQTAVEDFTRNIQRNK